MGLMGTDRPTGDDSQSRLQSFDSLKSLPSIHPRRRLRWTTYALSWETPRGHQCDTLRYGPADRQSYTCMR
jgi:hypothetical protein